MGRVVTPTFRVETDVIGPYRWTAAAWDSKRYGRPSEERLAEYVRRFEQSTQPGGVNEHVGPTTIKAARIVRQSNDEVVARYVASPFVTV